MASLIKDFAVDVKGWVERIPGNPPQPAYCIDRTEQVPVYTITPGFTDGMGVYHPPQLVFVGYKPAIVHKCFPAQPGTPDQFIEHFDASLRNERGWTASADSIASFVGGQNFQFKFTVPADSVGVVVGLSIPSLWPISYSTVTGLYCNNGEAQTIRAGELSGDNTAFSSTDEFVIVRRGALLDFYINGTQFNSWYDQSYDYDDGRTQIGAALYQSGDRVVGAEVEDVSALFSVGQFDYTAVYGDLGTGLIGFASDNDQYLSGEMTGLSGESESYNTGEIAGALSRTVGEAYGGPAAGDSYSISSGLLTSITGDAEQYDITPQFAVADGLLTGVCGFSTTLVGTAGACYGDVTAVSGFSSNVSGGFLAGGVLTGLSGAASQQLDGHATMAMVLRPATGMSFGAIEYVVDPAGNPLPGYGLYGVAPKAALLSCSGATLKRTLGKATLVASGTVTLEGTVEVSATRATLRATGTYTDLGTMSAVYDTKYPVVARAGASSSSAYARATASASGLVGKVGRVYGVAPKAVLYATGTVSDFATVGGVLPAVGVVNAGRMLASWGRPSLSSVGRVEVTVEYEGYSVTFVRTQDGEFVATTRLDSFPFDRIVRWGDKYVGVGATGLYELGGGDLDGLPIVSTVATAETDFGYPEFKRPVGLFLSGRAGADMSVTVNTAETDDDTYPYRPVQKTGARTYRALFGKGLRAHYWSYKLSNVNGEDFALDDMTPDIAVTRRTV